MDIQKEREAFEDWYIRNMDTNGDFEKISEQDSPYMDEHVNNSWLTWQAAKAQAVPEWISVKDSLPNRQVNVLVASKHNFVCIASLTNNHKNNKFYDGDGLAINSITHWMPLPKPPKSTGASQ